MSYSSGMEVILNGFSKAGIGQDPPSTTHAESSIRAALGTLDVAYTAAQRIYGANPDITSEQSAALEQAHQEWIGIRHDIHEMIRANQMEAAYEETKYQIDLYRQNYDAARRTFGPMMDRFTSVFPNPTILDDLIEGRAAPSAESKKTAFLIFGIVGALIAGIALSR